MKRNAFTLTEVVIALLVLGILAASLTLNSDSARQTAKREAERIVTQLYRLMETANRTHISFRVLFDGSEQTKEVPVEWQTPATSQFDHTGYYRELKITDGCSVQNLNKMSSLSRHNLVYSIDDNVFLPPSMTLKVKGQDKSVHYIVIYVPGTRIRLSDTSAADAYSSDITP